MSANRRTHNRNNAATSVDLAYSGGGKVSTEPGALDYLRRHQIHPSNNPQSEMVKALASLTTDTWPQIFLTLNSVSSTAVSDTVMSQTTITLAALSLADIRLTDRVPPASQHSISLSQYRR